LEGSHDPNWVRPFDGKCVNSGEIGRDDLNPFFGSFGGYFAQDCVGHFGRAIAAHGASKIHTLAHGSMVGHPHMHNLMNAESKHIEEAPIKFG
jgi:hypothetical protein